MELLWLVSTVTVAIQALGYKPKQLDVTVGTRVVWTNQDEIAHTVTATADSGTAPLFSGALSGKGQSFSFTFERAGTVSYHCARHTFMRGAIRVSPKGDR
ncbi:MAG: plastocyanin/azurin family copper-binding protein [Gemmatimonadales bacterium]